MINVAIAIVGTALAAAHDFKTGYISDLLTHTMMICGVVLMPILYPTNFIYGYIVAAAVLAIGFAAYAFGQLGGGDVKLFTALALLLPFYPTMFQPVASQFGITPVVAPYPFIVTLFLTAGIIGSLIFIPTYYMAKLVRIRGRVKDFNKKLVKGIAYSALISPVFIMYAAWFPGFLLLFPPVALGLVIIPFKNDTLEHFSIKPKAVKDWDDDEVIALEFISDDVKKKLGLWRKTFTDRELAKIKERAKKYHIKRLPVCAELPRFGPFILISLVISLFFGDMMLYVMSAMYL